MIDEGILKKLEEYGFEMDYVEQCIRNKRHNNASSSYYLLKKKMKGNKEILEERESRSKREVSISVEKNSSNLFPKNKSIKEIVSARVEYISDNNKMIEEYSGPFHLNQVVCKDESIIMSQILNFISMRNYDLLTVNRYQILF